MPGLRGIPRSKVQVRKMFALAKKKEISLTTAKKFARKAKDMRLPERLKKKK